MKLSTHFTIFAFSLVMLFSSELHAHYLWVTIDNESGEHGVANIYFEGGPFPGDGSYLDRFFKSGKTWQMVPAEEPSELENTDVKQPEKKKRWVTAELSKDSPRAVESYFKFGVYHYGETFVLLHYYARNLDLTSHEDLHDLARSKKLDLEIVPHDEGAEVELKVFWKDKPVAGRTVKIRGPKKFQLNVQTNKDGAVRFKPETKGQYTFLTNVEEKETGTDDGEDYSLIRHNSSLVMTLPLEN